MNQQILDLRRRMLGSDHPETLASMNNLAGVLNSQKKYEESERMYREALNRRAEVLGKAHPETLASMNDLAGVLNSQEKYEESEQMYREALNLTEKVSGQHRVSNIKIPGSGPSNAHDLVRSQAVGQEVTDTIIILEAIKKIYDTPPDAGHLPTLFRDVGQRLPLALETLRTIEKAISSGSVGGESYRAMKPSLEGCKKKAERLEHIFQAVAVPPDSSIMARYRAAIRRLGRGSQVEVLMRGMLEDIRILAGDDAIKGETEVQVEGLLIAIDELSAMEPSISNEESATTFFHYGSGNQINVVGSQNINTGSGKQFNAEAMYFGKN